MQTNIFPSEFNRIIDERSNDATYVERRKGDQRIASINNSRTSAPEMNGIKWGGGIGVFCGIIACLCSMSLIEEATLCGEDLIWSVGLTTLMVVIGICIALGASIDKSAKNDYENNQANTDLRIKEEQKFIGKKVQEIQNEAYKEKIQYLTEFENNAQSMSIRFATSELAKEVIEWMTSSFCKNIDATDRRSHIEKIKVPFIFHVYADKITCNAGTFDFELKRCRNLNSPLEQAALARAIVSAIQLNIIMKYPKDLSGTDISINISYSYINEYVATTITYVALNGNYKAVRGW